MDGHFAIGNFLRDALAGRELRLASGGEAIRSYLYSGDLAVWLLILLLEAEHGAKVNVGSGRAIRVVDLARRVCDLVNPALEVVVGVTSPGHERSIYVPEVKCARKMGLDSWTDLDQAIMRTAEWYRQ
jgi:dTDP-glucose 4,6-dehydratase